jgi:uncharacterized membrane protein
MAGMQRVLRHLFARSAKSLFPPATLQRIAQAIAVGEAGHRGQVCFAVESALPIAAVVAGQDARRRAEDAFARLRVWDTADNNGVLIYLLLADRRIEIVADRGVAALVDAAQWRAICTSMEQRLKDGDAEAAAIAGISAVSAVLATHFPRTGDQDRRNELPDLPQILD